MDYLAAWQVTADILARPAVSASLAAMAMSSLKALAAPRGERAKKLIETLMVGVLAFVSIPVLTVVGLPPSLGAATGAMLGFMGVHWFERRIDQFIDGLSPAEIISKVIDRIRGPRQ